MYIILLMLGLASGGLNLMYSHDLLEFIKPYRIMVDPDSSRMEIPKIEKALKKLSVEPEMFHKFRLLKRKYFLTLILFIILLLGAAVSLIFRLGIDNAWAM